MKIEFIQPYTTKAGKVFKVGDPDDCDYSVFKNLEYEGIAKRHVYKTAAERLAAETPGKPIDPKLIEWGKRTLSDGRVQLFRRQVCTGESTYFKVGAPLPADCPQQLAQEILAAYRNLAGAETYEAWRERVDREQYDQKKKERLDLCRMGLSHLFYGDGK